MSNYNRKNLSITVRKNINKYRIISDLTLQELADKSNLSHGYIRDLESLKLDKTPSLETLGNIANALNIKIEKLFEE